MSSSPFERWHDEDWNEDQLTLAEQEAEAFMVSEGYQPHGPVDFNGRTVCKCGDFDCASLK